MNKVIFIITTTLLLTSCKFDFSSQQRNAADKVNIKTKNPCSVADTTQQFYQKSLKSLKTLYYSNSSLKDYGGCIPLAHRVTALRKKNNCLTSGKSEIDNIINDCKSRQDALKKLYDKGFIDNNDFHVRHKFYTELISALTDK